MKIETSTRTGAPFHAPVSGAWVGKPNLTIMRKHPQCQPMNKVSPHRQSSGSRGSGWAILSRPAWLRPLVAPQRTMGKRQPRPGSSWASTSGKPLTSPSMPKRILNSATDQGCPIQGRFSGLGWENDDLPHISARSVRLSLKCHGTHRNLLHRLAPRLARWLQLPGLRSPNRRAASSRSFAPPRRRNWSAPYVSPMKPSPSYAQTSGKTRAAFLRRIADAFESHRDELAQRAPS